MPHSQPWDFRAASSADRHRTRLDREGTEGLLAEILAQRGSPATATVAMRHEGPRLRAASDPLSWKAERAGANVAPRRRGVKHKRGHQPSATDGTRPSAAAGFAKLDDSAPRRTARGQGSGEHSGRRRNAESATGVGERATPGMGCRSPPATPWRCPKARRHGNGTTPPRFPGGGPRP